MRVFFAAAMLCLVTASAADARPRHHHHRHHSSAASADAIGHRPAGCPRAWCGCWMMLRHGLTDRRLWVAREWSRVGSASQLAVGAIVAFPHHVVEVTEVLGGGLIRAISGNDGRAVRNRVRSIRGAIAIRRL